MISSIELEGRQLSTTITDDGFRVEYADGLPGTLAIDDAEGSSMALDLGINNSGSVPTSPVIGDRLAPRVTPLTKIADLDGGNGLDLSSGIRIAQGTQIFDINLDNAETLSDGLIAINRSDADVHAELNEAEGRILIRAGRSGVGTRRWDVNSQDRDGRLRLDLDSLQRLQQSGGLRWKSQ